MEKRIQRTTENQKCDINGGVFVLPFSCQAAGNCKGCFNSMTWDFNYGKKWKTEEEILEAKSYIDGLSLLGGEQ